MKRRVPDGRCNYCKMLIMMLFMNYGFIFVFSTAKNINFYQLNHQDYEICRITSSFMFRGRGIDERHAGE